MESRAPEPSGAILDSRTLQSTPESGGRASYDGAKRRKGSKLHAAVDSLGHVLALHVTPANAQDWVQVGQLADAVPGYTGAQPAEEAAQHGIRLEVVKLPEAKRGFVFLPWGGIVERGFAWTRRFRRLASADERWQTTLEGFHYVGFALLALNAARPLLWLL